MSFLGKCVVVFYCLLLIPAFSFSQSCANYSVARTTGIGYTTIVGTGTSNFIWRNTTSNQNDDNRSYPVSLGFDFWYLGVRYNTISAALNGYVDFSSSTANGNGHGAAFGSNYSPETPYHVGGTATGTMLALAPMYSDIWTAGSATTPIASCLVYKLTGAEPNRVFTVEWVNFDEYGSSTGSINMQVKIYESTGVIEFLYGTMTAGSAALNYCVGINNNWDPAAAPNATQMLDQQTANTATFNNTVQNALTTLPASNSKLTFMSPVPTAAPSALNFTAVSKVGMTLNWTDNATNEVGYVIYNSTDNVTFNYVSQVAANSVSAAMTSLYPGTTYYWKVYAVTDGCLSAALTGTQATLAAGNYVSIASTSWNTTTTWDCTCIPTAGDNVTIANGTTVTLDVDGACHTLTVGQGASGQLTIGNSAVVRTLTVNTDVTVSSGATMTIGATAATHLLNMGGNLSNSGTLNFLPGAGRICNVTFNKNGNQTISGAGATNNFNRITLNMGASNTNVLEVTSTNFTIGVTNFLTLTNGTFKLSTATATLTPFTAATTMPLSTGIWMNHAGATMTTGNTVTLFGYIRATAGTLNIGNATNENLTPNGGIVTVDGGTINVAGRFQRAGVPSLLSFTISSGTFKVANVGSSTASVAPFMISEVGSTFDMSGGTIIVVRPGAGNLGYINTGGTVGSVTGGTVQMGDGTTPAAQTMQINSSVSVYDLVISNGVAVTAQLVTSNLTVLNNFTINSGTFNPAGLNFTVNGTSGITGAYSDGTLAGTSTFTGLVTLNAGGTWTSTAVTTTGSLIFMNGIANNGTSFSAGGATFSTNIQNITGTTSLSFANSVSVGNRLGNQLASPLSITIGGDLIGAGEYRHTFTNSILNIAGNVTISFFSVTFNGNTVVYNGTGSQTLKGTTYHHLTINKTAGVATADAAFTCNGDLTINNAGTLGSGNFTHTVSGATSISAGLLRTDNTTSVFNLQSLTMTGGTIAGAAAGTVSVATTFSVPSGTATINTCTFTVENATSVTGTLVFDINNSGLNTFKGTVTLNPGSVWNSSALTSTSANLVFRGGIVSNGTSFSAGSCRFNTSTPQAVSGSTSLIFSNRVTVTSPTVLTNNMTSPAAVIVGGDLSSSGTFVQGANSLLTIAGDASITTLTASASPNTVTYNGSTVAQSVKGTTYDNLVLNNSFATSPQFTPSASYTVNSTLTMTDGNMDLSTFTVTIGTAAGTPGALVHSAGTAGWMYGGQITRWFNTVTVADGAVAGLFPIGTLADYRPFYVSYPVTAPSTGGTMNISYTDATTTTTGLSIADAPGTIQVRHDAFWTLSNGNSLTAAGSATELRADPTGLVGIGNVNDLRLMLAASIIGTPGTNGGTPAAPIIRRIAIPGYGPGTISRNLYVGSIDGVSSPLPVELLSFDAKPNGKIVEVSWSTAAEFNSDHFIVQRSQDGIVFEDVLQVGAAGNSSTVKEYASEDTDPYSGVSYYRLKQVDLDGKYKYSQIVNVQFGTEHGFSVYPNPSSGPFHVSITGQAGEKVLIVVRDVLGKESYSEIFLLSASQDVIAIDPSGKLKPGVYLVTASSDDKIYEKKIVIR